LMAAVAIHLPLLLMQLPLKSFDTNFHILFASHYVNHWFDPWNPKWYAGFSQMTYPPLPQQWVAILSRIFGLDMAYMAVQFVAILLLVVGVYRFSLLWVSPRAASIAALASVFLGSESFLVYSAGQLGTTCAAPIYLNALPFLFEWVRFGKWRSFLKACVLFAAAAAAHHATLLFGSFLFAVPVLVLAFLDRQDGERVSTPAFVSRTALIAVVVGGAIAIVLLPFWIALIHNPVTQTPIPHQSRASYILSPQWGMNYFVIPYGALILALPFIFLRGSMVARLRPLLFGFWIAFLLGLGGTTPVGHILLGRAFDVLTMERFTYWATLLALPFVGLLAAELVARYRTTAIVGLTTLAAITCAAAVGWSTYRPADAEDFKVDTVASWLNRDGHDQYRYFTLGFGNKNALRAMLAHADHYGIKWVFVRDHYYDPLLSFAGWRPVDNLDDKTITVWSKDGVPPATPVNANQIPPRWQGLMWGILPFGSSLLAIIVVFIPEKRRQRYYSEAPVETPVTAGESLAHGRLVS